MKTLNLILLVFLGLNCSWGSASGQFSNSSFAPRHDQASSTAFVNSDVVVYVSDFELRVMDANGSSAANSGNAAGSNAARTKSSTTPRSTAASGPKPRRPVWQETDLPPARANKLVDFMSVSLTIALQKAGYTVHVLKAGEGRPSVGVLLRGVFAEPDEQNHIRLALLGSGTAASQFLLYVGVQNLARPDQRLYEIANPNAPGLSPPEGKTSDRGYGPVITVTPYAPAMRFVLDKDPTEEQVRKIASDTVASLTALLNANPAVGQ